MCFKVVNLELECLLLQGKCDPTFCDLVFQKFSRSFRNPMLNQMKNKLVKEETATFQRLYCWFVFALGKREDAASAPVAHSRLPKWRDDGRVFSLRFVDAGQTEPQTWGQAGPGVVRSRASCRTGEVVAVTTGNACSALNSGRHGEGEGSSRAIGDPHCKHEEPPKPRWPPSSGPPCALPGSLEI